ncbi:leukocyte receptor cluster member 1 [Rhinatrema bivittatum]|uniref:leukocyte receptor cluster member 1 n=1 Tax=Rhinatrema bivittatum TaxID=194408 RepID=UPI001128A372|nr:leukocyte receptor cluster member 1 [Rhinatrema bivittatum]
MNILPKKSWHVRNKDNVARVRRDEALAAEDERERKRRADLAEQEARTNLLRKKARHSLPDSISEDGAVLVACKPDSSHVNFFQDAEEGRASRSGNKEHEEEKRQEKERQEKALGLLTYLGQSSAEAQTSRPWYQELPERSAREGPKAESRDERLKAKLDPLHDMEKHLRKKKGEKKGDKRERERKGGESRSSSSTTASSIDKMRQERLKREAVERARAAALLDRKQGAQQAQAPEEMDERRRSYNSQFHPQLARKPWIQ